jgi:hypothetical protein
MPSTKLWKLLLISMIALPLGGDGISGAIIAFIAGPLIVRRFKQIRSEVEG